MGKNKSNKKARASQAQADSSVLLDTRCIVIPVMGPTGVGKSTFINAVLNKSKMKVGKEIESCTVDIATADIGDLRSLFPHLQGLLRERRVLLVDTPGFDDTFVDDSVILERIANWLKNSYHTNALGGVIYLHDISIDRYTGSTKKNLNMFKHLCGDGALDKVVLGITKGSRLSEWEARKRLTRLKEAHWNDMIKSGASVASFEGNQNSALDVVREVLSDYKKGGLGIQNPSEGVTLQIQAELVDEDKIIPETEAGKELRLTIKQLLEHQKRYAQLSENVATADDPAAQADIQDAKRQIENLQKQLQDLRVPLLRRLIRLFR